MFNIHFKSSCVQKNNELTQQVEQLDKKLRAMSASHKFVLKTERNEHQNKIDELNSKNHAEMNSRIGSMIGEYIKKHDDLKKDYDQLVIERNRSYMERDKLKDKYNEVNTGYSNAAAELEHIRKFIERSGEAIGSGNEYILDTKYILGMQQQIDNLKTMVSILTPKPKRKYTQRIKVTPALIPLGNTKPEWSGELAYPKGQTHILENGFYSKGRE